MRYKRKEVTKHRYKQLVKSRENFRKMIDEINPKSYVHPKEFERYKTLFNE